MSTYIDALAWLPKCFMSYVDGVNVWPLVSGIITLFKASSYLVFAPTKQYLREFKARINEQRNISLLFGMKIEEKKVFVDTEI